MSEIVIVFFWLIGSIATILIGLLQSADVDTWIVCTAAPTTQAVIA